VARTRERWKTSAETSVEKSWEKERRKGMGPLPEPFGVLPCEAMPGESLELLVERLVLEYAQSLPPARPLDPGLSLRDDLVIESLSLVSLTLQLGDELGVNVVDLGLELGDLRTLGDLVSMARTISRASGTVTLNRSA